jgi:glycosyltransferase involved in cell wall biosynthesis
MRLEEERTTIVYPYLRWPATKECAELRECLARAGTGKADGDQLAERILHASCTLDDVLRTPAAGHGGARGTARPPDQVAARLQSTGVLGLIELSLAPRYDLIVVEQGYGGVYVHTLELVKRLRRRWRVLLLSLAPLPYDPEAHPDNLILTHLRAQDPRLSFFSCMHLLRSVVQCTHSRMLLITHRSMATYLFDCVRNQPTVIYSDGYYEKSYATAQSCATVPAQETQERILGEIYFLAHHAVGDGLDVSPRQNRQMLMAGYYALVGAAENWCWGYRQYQMFKQAFGSVDVRVRHVPPFLDPDIYVPRKVARRRVLLFTTTMHNIEKKGLPELVLALGRVPQARAICVVGQVDKLPSIPDAVRARMDIQTIAKATMVDLYHQVWLNCRVSREDSSPLSVLETMICEVPQIVSPAVGEEIPILEDGVTGFIVAPDDIERFAWALKILLSDEELRNRMGRACRQRAAQYSLNARMPLLESFLP